MSTFDEVLPKLTELFLAYQEDITKMKPIIINRDLKGRVRLIVDDKWEGTEHQQGVLNKIVSKINEELGPHAYPVKQALLFEPDCQDFLERESSFLLEGLDGVSVIDRLAVEGNWSRISNLTSSVPRTVFFQSRVASGDQPHLPPRHGHWLSKAKKCWYLIWI